MWFENGQSIFLRTKPVFCAVWSALQKTGVQNYTLFHFFKTYVENFENSSQKRFNYSLYMGTISVITPAPNSFLNISRTWALYKEKSLRMVGESNSTNKTLFFIKSFFVRFEMGLPTILSHESMRLASSNLEVSWYELSRLRIASPTDCTSPPLYFFDMVQI